MRARVYSSRSLLYPQTEHRESPRRNRDKPQNAIVAAVYEPRRRKDKPVFAVRSHFCRLLARVRAPAASERASERTSGRTSERASEPSGAGVIYAKSLMLAKQGPRVQPRAAERPSWAPLVSPGPREPIDRPAVDRRLTNSPFLPLRF